MTILSKEFEEYELLMDALSYLVRETFAREDLRHRSPIQNLIRAINCHITESLNGYEQFGSQYEQELVLQGIEFARRLRQLRGLR